MPSIAASQGTITAEELKLRPAYRVGQLLESVPGLVVTVHSGEGKANQFLARGFNLDHGTDIANFIDDMPVNRPTNAHGEGYSDLNFIVPEVLDGLDYTKGTYYPSIGNFGDVASVHLRIADTIPNEVTLAATRSAASAPTPAPRTARVPTDRVLARRSNSSGSTARSSRRATSTNTPASSSFSQGRRPTASTSPVQYYHGTGLFVDRPAARAAIAGLIGRYGTLDPTDGTSNDRLSVSGHYAVTGNGWRLAVNAYLRPQQPDPVEQLHAFPRRPGPRRSGTAGRGAAPCSAAGGVRR